VAWTAAQTWSAATRRSVRASLRGFWEWATRTGRCTTSPAIVLPKVREPDHRPRPTPDAALREAIMRADHRVRLMIELGAHRGLRRAEVACVHISDLVQDLDGWTLLVHGKGGRRRFIPLDNGLADRIRAACQDGAGYAFPGKIDGHLSPRWVGELVAEALPGEWTMHSLRHRFATKTWRATNDLLAVQQLLGHSTPTITQRYVDVDRARLRVVAQTAA
jgi:site-specific recombinase XerD